MAPLGTFLPFLKLPHLRAHYCGFRERHARSCAPSSERCCSLEVPVGDYKKIFPELYTYTRALALETGSKITWAAGSLTTSVLRVGPQHWIYWIMDILAKAPRDNGYIDFDGLG